MCFHHESLDYDHFLSIFSIFPISLSIFPYLQTLKTTFPLSIKGFQSLKGAWKHLIGSFHFRIHVLPFIDHFRFLNLKIQKKSTDFNLSTFLHVDSTSIHHRSNLKIRFEEFSIFFISKFAHSTTIFLCISKGIKNKVCVRIWI